MVFEACDEPVNFFALYKNSLKFAFPWAHAHTHTHTSCTPTPHTHTQAFMLSCLHARIAQLVEHDLAKVGVAGSSPVSRSK